MARDYSIYTPDTQSEYKTHIDGLARFYKRDPRNLIAHLKKMNYSDQKIADIMGISRQAMYKKYWPINESEQQ